MPVPSPSHFVGKMEIQGIANGTSKIPDSPESAGFLDATKKTQEKTAPAANKKSPAAMLPPRDFLNARAIVLPPNARLQRRVALGTSIARRYWAATTG